MSSSKPIGIFDSGIGGLTVLREVIKQLPYEDLIYFGDTERAPYGEKSKEEIVKINFDIINFLIKQNVKMIIIGCNTSSALALEANREMFPMLPIVDLIQPGAREAVRKCHNHKIGVIATTATVNSSAYRNKILNIDSEKEVVEIACPKFVPLIENGIIEGPMVEIAVNEYLWPMQHFGIDTLIFGCTHYPFLIKPIKQLLGEDKNYIDPAVSTVFEAKAVLNKNNLTNNKDKKGEAIYYTSGSSEKFEKLSGLFLGKKIEKIQKHSLKPIREIISQ